MRGVQTATTKKFMQDRKYPKNTESQHPKKRNYHLDNFVIQSRKFLQNLPALKTSPRELKKKQENTDEIFKTHSYYLNGVNYFSNRVVLEEKGEVLRDCNSVRGENFYLKKGEIVLIIAIACEEYAEVYHRDFRGYFPLYFFRLLSQY